jgi:hypothetical protein
MKILLYIDAHDSAADSKVYAIPMAIVPRAVKKVLNAQPNHLDISVDEDGWGDHAEAVTNGIGDSEKLAYDCSEFFASLEIEGVTGLQLLSKPTITKYIVKQWSS